MAAMDKIAKRLRKPGKITGLLVAVLALLFLFWGCGPQGDALSELPGQQTEEGETVVTLSDLPEYAGEAWVSLNGGRPDFTEADMTTEAFETYQELDALGRCGVAYANVCRELMPTEERGEIGQVKPSGWHTVKYDIVEGKYLYNRCHLIGYQLSGENANEKNLITGTRYLNTEGMLYFENLVADYVEETGNHVLYRVTPVFEGENLVAGGVTIEAYSVEDDGEGLQFYVYCYNVQPGIMIDYATGESWLSEETAEKTAAEESGAVDGTGENVRDTAGVTYILNTNTHKFHLPDCGSVQETKPQNRKEFTGTREEVMAQGYEPCGRCKP